MSQWSCFRLETGLLDSVSIQWNGSWDIHILNFSKILLKFVIVSKIVQYFLSFSVLTTIIALRNVLGLGDGLLDRTFQSKTIQKMVLNFLLRVENCFNFAFISFFYMICLLTMSETRSCRVESHHGIYSYPFFSLSVRVSFLLVTFYLSLSLSLYLSLSLSLSLLIPHFSCCYVA